MITFSLHDPMEERELYQALLYGTIGHDDRCPCTGCRIWTALDNMPRSDPSELVVLHWDGQTAQIETVPTAEIEPVAPEDFFSRRHAPRE